MSDGAMPSPGPTSGVRGSGAGSVGLNLSGGQRTYQTNRGYGITNPFTSEYFESGFDSRTVSIYDIANQGGWDYNYRQFISIVAGEASNFDDAAGIGSVLLNRMAAKGVTFNDNNWLYAISVHHKGKTVDQDIHSAYNAYGGTIYNSVMTMSAVALSQSGYALRVAGANEAYAGYMEGFDYSNGAYIWNASSQQYKSNPGFNFNMVNQGIYTVTGTLGGTTFMRYTDERKTWP